MAQQESKPIRNYVSGVAFGEKSTPDYTWDGVFIENKQLETKYLPNDVMKQLEGLSDDVSLLWGRTSSAQSTANNALTNANSALSEVKGTQITANNAQTAANNAQTTADKAQTAADKAQTTASKAQTTANNAQTTAENAQTIAQSTLSMLPTVTSTDSGKFLRVSAEGKWVAEAIANAEGASF